MSLRPCPFLLFRCRGVYLMTALYLKLAVTERLLFIVTVQVVLLPEQSPDQPTNVWPLLGTAVNVIVAPAVAEQVPMQGPPLTVPKPTVLVVSGKVKLATRVVLVPTVIVQTSL